MSRKKPSPAEEEIIDVEEEKPAPAGPPPSPPLDAVGLAALLAQVADLARRDMTPKDETFHVCIIPDSDDPVDREFPTLAEAAAFIATYHGQDVSVRAYVGGRCRKTKGPMPWLISPSGERAPLFVTPDEDDEDESGSMALPPTQRVVIPAEVIDEDSQSDDDDTEDEDEL